MADVLKVEPADLTVSMELDKESGKIVTEFGVDLKKVEGPEPSEVREVIGIIFSDHKQQMRERLKGLHDTWESYAWKEITEG
jgi:hypothetical protein